METEQQLPRPFYYLSLYAAALIATFSLASWVNEHPLSAILAAIFAALSVTHHILSHRKAVSQARWVLRVATLLLLVVTYLVLAGLAQPMLSWLFLLPMLAFMAWRLAMALALTLVFVGMVILLAPQGHLGAERHQLVPMLMLATVLTGIFVFLREFKAAQLAPLRRTDALTLASSHETLQSDLYKEIQRSEREGTALAVIEMALDEPGDQQPPLPSADRNAIIHGTGRMLHQNLRDFDSYYRTADATFFLILPVTETHGAAAIAEALRREARTLMQSNHLNLTLSAGVAALNVGDDAESLKEKAHEALMRAQQQGGNRIQSYTGRSHSDHD